MRIDGAVVGHAEPAVLRGGRIEGGADRGDRRIAAAHQDLPLELAGGVIEAVRRDLDDVAEAVVGARVGGVDLIGLALASCWSA